MSEQSDNPDAALDKLKRIQELSYELPEIVYKEGFATVSLFDEAIVDSPGPGSLETSVNVKRPSQPKPVAPKSIGNYEVLAILGRGGMGMVFHAHDRKLNRPVALKMLIGVAAHDKRLSQRFMIEGQALAKLEHPNIVPVYEAGDWEGISYIAMKHVRGGTLAQNSDRLRSDPNSAIRVLAKIARAVGYLHSQGVSHRDLKPANILLGEGDEPLVADFGLAKFHNTDSDLTMSGVLLGTRYYMAPEQTRAQHRLSAPACDTWSLGVIAYELFTNRLPFEADNYEELFRQIRVEDPQPITGPHGEPMPAIDTIVRRCLQKNPAHRYPDCAALADDLERVLRGEAIAPVKPQGSRWTLVGGVILAASVLLALLAVTLWKPKPHDKPVRGLLPATQATREVFIGETANGANITPVLETKPTIGHDAKGRLTLRGGKEPAIVWLANRAFTDGTVIEATVQQLEATSFSTLAGVLVRAKMFDRTPGKRINCLAFTVDTIMNRAPDNQRPILDYGSVRLDLARWDNTQKPLFVPGPFTSLRRTVRATSPMAGPVHALRIEIDANGSIRAFVDDSPLKVATDEAIHKTYVKFMRPDSSLPLEPEDRFGDGIGLIAEDCTAAFWNVSVAPLVKPAP